MDYHNMKRSELQALCKEHKIPANSANSVMIDKLSQLLNVKQEKQKPRTRQRTCIKSSAETIDESESAVSRRQTKKVRFSPEVEYERSGKKHKAIEPVITGMKGRTRSLAKKVDEPAVDNVNNATDDDVQIPIKVTRSRAHILEKVDVISTNGRKQGRRAVKDVQKETDAVQETEGNLDKVTRSKANTVGKGDAKLDKSKPSKREVKDVEKESEPVKETVVVHARVTRSKAQTVTEESKEPDLSPQIKKKRGRQTEKDEVKVELSKEVKDVPVRATRSRGQTLNIDSVVANPPAEKKRTRRDDSEVVNPPIEKKRTRRDTIVADLSHNTSNEDKGEKLGGGKPKKISEGRVAEVPETQDNAAKGTRQSRRNKATVEASTVVNQNVNKVESVNEKRVTRSKAPPAKKSSGSKAEVQQLEEPLEPRGRRNVNQRKSVIQPKVTEVVLPLEEPVNIPKKDTKRKPVVQKAQRKESKKSSVGKKEIVEETEMPKSPTRKTVEKKQSKDASENEMKAVASGSGSKKSRKRSGDPIIEDQVIKPEPVSTRKNSVAKKEQESGLKTPESRKGAMSGDNRSKKRAKLSGIKQSDSEDHVEKSISMETPILKMANLELDDKVMETEKTPAIVESGRRFTRGAIKSDRKEASHSAIKEQNTGVARFSSRKTPGRFTRSGIKVDEKEQPSESTHQIQSFDDALKASHEDAEAEPSLDESIAVPIEVPKEVNTQIIEESDNLSALEPLELPIIDALSDGSHVHNQNQEDNVSLEIVREAEVQVAVNSEKSVVPEVSEKETESTSEGLEDNVRVEEPSVSAVKAVVIEESDSFSLEQSDIKGNSKEIEALVEPSMVEGVNQFIADDQACANIDDDDLDNEEDEKASNQKHEDVEDLVDAQEMDLEHNRDVIQESTSGDDKLQGLGMDENDPKDEKVTVPESLTTHTEPEKEFDVVEAEHSEPAKEVESDIVLSAVNDVHEIPILGKSDDKDEGVDNVRKHESSTNEQDKESEQSEQEQLTSQYSFAMEDQDVGDDEPEPVPVENEKLPMLPEVFTSSPELPEDLTNSPDQKPELSVSFAVDEVPCDTVDASTSKEAPQNPALLDEEKQKKDYSNHGEAQENPAIEESLPAVYTKEESTVDGLATNQVPGDIGAYESRITEEESTSFKDEERTEQEDWGNYSHGTDEFQKPVSANESDDVADQSTKDDQVSEFQTSAKDEASTPTTGDANVGFFNWSDSSLKELLKTPATTKVSHAEVSQQSVVRSAIPAEDGVEGKATPYPDLSLKSLFTAPATTRENHQQSTIRFDLPVEDDIENNTTSNPHSSMKVSLTTPATTRVSYEKGPEQNTVKFAVPNEDDMEHNATQNPASSLKALFKTPATTQTSHVQDYSSLKTLFATPVTTQISRVNNPQENSVSLALSVEDENATPNPALSLNALFTTPATTRVSHVEDHQESTVKTAIQEEDDTQSNATQNSNVSLKALFATPAIIHVEDNQQSVDDTNTTQGQNSSLKVSLNTPGTTQSHAKHLEEKTAEYALPNEDNTEGNAPQATPAATQNQDLSLRTLFATQVTTRVSHVKEHDQSTVRFELPDEDDNATHSTTQVSYVQHSHQSTVRFHEDEKQGTSTQNQGHDEDRKSETFRDLNFQEFAHKYFDDDEVDYYPGDNSSKDQVDEIKQQELQSEVAGTSHHDASGLKDGSFFTGEDNIQGTTTHSTGASEDPKSEIFGGPNFDFARKFFDDEVDFGSSDNSGDEMK